MKNVLTPQQTLSNSYRSEAVDPKDYKKYEESLNNLMEKPLDNVNDKKEANVEDYVRDFLKEAYDDYGKKYSISKKRNIDYVIFHDTIEKDPAVLLEFKRPSEKKDMCSYTDANNYNINVKALQQLLYYFVQERNNGSNRIQHLIICNGLEWYIFEATLMNRLFYEDSEFKNICLNYSNNEMTDNSTSSAFEAIERLIEPKLDKIQFTYLNLKTLKSDTPQTTKTQYYKIISPRHLLNIKSADSTYGLDKGFYKELLYIMGLEEKKEKGKTLITRLKKSDRKVGSLIELAIRKIESKSNLSNLNNIESYGETKEDQIFGISLQLVIIWINRILFLKLLEAQLSSYHVGTHIYSFMDFSKVTSFDVLETLFFEVLNKKQNERNDVVKDKYSHIPYLNSSLFEESQIENDTISISNLSDETNLSYIDNTVLKNKNSFDKNKEILTLNYLLDFLNSYDFYTESKEKIQSENKALIKANVLGLIFEKINGYKDGSFYTPGFITEYMCRETIRRTVVQKFNEKFDWNIEHFEDLFNKIDRLDDIEKANQVVNSITICDPAVGSGHFLVSALNEIILIKYELGIFCDVNNRRLVNYWQVEISDDELLFKNKINGNFFHYEVKEDGYINDDMQRLQKAIFHEKKTIIENCLFGVDINPNSVNICRLRLWIELLKNTYYENGELQTLPNIDINIKCGNSLISKYNVGDKNLRFKQADLKTLAHYKDLVKAYKEPSLQSEENRKSRFDLKFAIEVTKNKFKGHWQSKSDNEIKLEKAANKLQALIDRKENLFEKDEEFSIKREKIEKEIEALTEKVKKEEDIYTNSFEWRFEFPEVLNEVGDFVGFDIVIGNPPYGVSIRGNQRIHLIDSYGKVPDYEIYYWFIELGERISIKKGLLNYIIPNTILFNLNAKNYRINLLGKWNMLEILDCTNFSIFDNATVRNIILIFQKSIFNNTISYRNTFNKKDFKELINNKRSIINLSEVEQNNKNWGLLFRLDKPILDLIQKIKQSSVELNHFYPETSQGLIAYDKYTGQSEETIKNRIYHSFVKKDPNFKPWLYGSDVTKYNLKWNGKEYINYCDGIANPRDPKFFNSKRLLIREITNPSIFASLTSEEYYNDPALIIILDSPKRKIEFLLGLLNSKLATFVHFNSSPKATKGAFPKILVDDINTFPIPTIDYFDKQVIENVNQILVTKKENPEADTQKLEDEIDHLVYKLYGLTYDEVLIVDPETKLTAATY